jgi:hypothetical protein
MERGDSVIFRFDSGLWSEFGARCVAANQHIDQISGSARHKIVTPRHKTDAQKPQRHPERVDQRKTILTSQGTLF